MGLQAYLPGLKEFQNFHPVLILITVLSYQELRRIPLGLTAAKLQQLCVECEELEVILPQARIHCALFSQLG